MIPQQTIDEMSRKIVERFHPERIILFGSYARGEATENSDIDLLVVFKTPARRGKRAAPIIRMLAEEYDLPVDVIVRSPEGLNQWKNTPNSFARQVITRGVTLYEKAG